MPTDAVSRYDDETRAALEAADELRRLVLKRTGLHPDQLVCPREQSDMTPCLARDGRMAVYGDGACVGCGAAVGDLIDQERQRESQACPPTTT